MGRLAARRDRADLDRRLLHWVLLDAAGAPAPHSIGERIYTQATMTQMAVRYFKGEPIEKTLAWAESELEGFMRN